ncbi:MAG: phosphatase [Methanobacterium sp. ERen5]|nr:MAG: phosphatase [Methanobacterium sp. ERen5]
MSVGIIDIGSNSVKLNVYRSNADTVHIIFSRKESLGLVFYVKNGILMDEGIDKLLDMLKSLKTDLDYLKIDNYRFFATASLRNIKNSAQVIQIVKDEVKIDIDLLSSSEEGELSFLGSLSTIKEDEGILIDVGGGSVEVVPYKNREITQKYSIPVGSLKMYNSYVSNLIPTEIECYKIEKRVFSELIKQGVKNDEKKQFLCTVGGSVRAIEQLMVDLKIKSKDEEFIDIKQFMELKNQLHGNNKETYNKILHVKPSRIHLLVPTLMIVLAIASYFGCEKVQVSKFSVREGYLHKKY